MEINNFYIATFEHIFGGYTMKILKSSIALLLIIALLFGFIPFQQDVWAATMPVEIRVESYTGGNLTLSWSVSGANSYSIDYHKSDGSLQTISGSGSMATISDLENDYIYDFKLSVYSTSDSTEVP